MDASDTNRRVGFDLASIERERAAMEAEELPTLSSRLPLLLSAATATGD